MIMALCVNEWMLYVGGVIALLDATSTTMFRSLITKLVHADEVGKVFSVVGTFQALMPFAAGPIFGFLYKNTVSYLPSAFLFLISALKFVVFLIVVVVTILTKKILKEQRKHDEMKAQMQDFKKRNKVKDDKGNQEEP